MLSMSAKHPLFCLLLLCLLSCTKQESPAAPTGSDRYDPAKIRIICRIDASITLNDAIIALNSSGTHIAAIHADPSAQFKIYSFSVLPRIHPLFATNAADAIEPDSFRLSPDAQHTACAVYIHDTLTGPARVYLDQEAQTIFPAILADSLIFSPDSRHLAYLALTANRQTAVVYDGQILRTHGHVDPASLQFSPDSTRLLYIAAEPDSRGDHVIIDNGHTIATHPCIAKLTLSPDGKRLAFAAYNRTPATAPGNAAEYSEPTLYVDGQPFLAGAHRAIFSPDSRRIACIRGLRDKRFIYGLANQLILDGIADPPVPKIHTVVFSPDSRHVAYDVPGGSGLTSALVIDGIPYDPPVPIAFRALAFDSPTTLTATTISNAGGDEIYRRMIFTLSPLPAAAPATAP
jgi:hypothetical protein